MSNRDLPRRRAELIFAVLVGVLGGVACSGNMDAMADAAADSLLAADVPFDDAASGLNAETVQAAIDAVVVRLVAVEAQAGSTATDVAGTTRR